MFARVIVLVAVVNRPLLGNVLIPFLAMGAVVGGFAAVLYFRNGAAERKTPAKGDLEVANPFSLTEAAKFAAFFAVVLVAVKIVQQNFPPDWVYAVAGIAGLTDVDAITLSMAESAKTSPAQIAVTAIVIASLVNTFVKAGIGYFVAGMKLARPLLWASSVMLVVGLAAALVL
jgi:uncharacterized membrane protein (DUF4010 family)